MRQLTFVLGIALAVLLGSATLSTAQSKPAAAKQPAAKATAGAPINLNTATTTQLESLPGVGPAAAKRILEYRQKNGAFKKIEELMNVKGFGEKSFLKLKPFITVSADKPERPGEGK